MSRKLIALALGAMVVGACHAGKALADDLVVVESCGRGGCCHEGGVCRATTETKKIEKRVYSDTCEQFCLPTCGSLFGGLLGHGCGGDCNNGACHDGNCNQCSGPHTKKYLVVKIKHEEKCVTKCVVDHAGCAAPAGNFQPLPAKPMPAPKTAGQVLEYRVLPTANGR